MHFHIQSNCIHDVDVYYTIGITWSLYASTQITISGSALNHTKAIVDIY